MRDVLKDFFKFIRSSYAVVGFSLGFLAVLAITALAIFWLSRSAATQPQGQQTQTSDRPTLERLPETKPTLLEEDGQLFPSDLPVTYRVQSGDSSWRVARAFYGCGDNYQDIETANNLSAGQYLEVGQVITIPRVALRCQVQQTAVELSSNTAVTPPTAIITPQGETKTTTSEKLQYTVVTGDSLWVIAQRELGDAHRWPELYRRNQQLIGVNPDLIYPDQVLELPR